MLKWKTSIITAALALGLVGCTANQAQDANDQGAEANRYQSMTANDHRGVSPFANANLNDQNDMNPGAYYNNSIYKDGNTSVLNATNNRSRAIGHAIYTKRDMNGQQANTFHVDRNVLARGIATIVTSIPEVEKANVFVTDEEVIVGIPGVDEAKTLNKAKLAAWSMSPRYYKVYVTGDQNVIQQFDGLLNQSTNINQTMDQVDRILTTNNLTDMTGTNVTDNGQNVTDYNINQTFPNTNGSHRMKNR